MNNSINYWVGIGPILTADQVINSIKTIHQGVDIMNMYSDKSWMKLRCGDSIIELSLKEDITYFVVEEDGGDLDHFHQFFAEGFGLVFIDQSHPAYLKIRERTDSNWRTVALHIEIKHTGDPEGQEVLEEAKELVGQLGEMVSSNTVFNCWRSIHWQ